MTPKSGNTPGSSGTKLHIWLLTDQKPGHKNQLIGLLNGIKALRDCEAEWIDCSDTQAPKIGSASPDLVICCGHRTHLPALRIKLKYRCFLCVLMKPSLPLAWFNGCIIPAHDKAPDRRNVLTTSGVINKIIPSGNHESSKGLILAGGPSKHFRWNSAAVISHAAKIVEGQGCKWTLATSRRTPRDFVEHAKDSLPDVDIVLAENTSPDWLPEALSQSGQVWVTADSVSMVYEALSSGAATGVIPLHEKSNNRIIRGLNNVIEEQQIAVSPMPIGPPPKIPFNESRRASEWLMQAFDRWCR